MTKMAAASLLPPTDTPTLHHIIKQCLHTNASWGLKHNDVAFALAFWSMLQCGFRPAPPPQPPEDTSKLPPAPPDLPADWKHRTRHLYQALFFLPPHPDYPVKLVALPAGDVLCLNLLAANLSPKNISLKSLAVHSPGYVPRPEDDPARLSALADFHLLLKDLVIWPIRCSILTEQGIPNGSLCGLSDEMKLKIARHLGAPELLVLSQTCHDLNRICSDQGLWKGLFHGRFLRGCKCPGGPEECEEELDWKEEFKRAYSRKQREGSPPGSPSGSYRTPPEMYSSPAEPHGSVAAFSFD